MNESILSAELKERTRARMQSVVIDRELVITYNGLDGVREAIRSYLHQRADVTPRDGFFTVSGGLSIREIGQLTEMQGVRGIGYSNEGRR